MTSLPSSCLFDLEGVSTRARLPLNYLRGVTNQGLTVAALVKQTGRKLGDDRRMASDALSAPGLPGRRVDVRLPTEVDRGRFVKLFGDEAFMVFSAGALTEAEAHARFDRMLVNAAELAFAKQPVIERSSGLVIGYAGVDWFDFESERWLELGYRLVPGARGKGYGTEASRAILAAAAASPFEGVILAIIDPVNEASHGVARKLGFEFWKQAVVDGCVRDLYRTWIS